MNFISTYSLNTKELELVDSDCAKYQDWDELICENDGRFCREGEFMLFSINGLDLVVSYDLDVSAKIDYDPGDYYTPPYMDIDITDESIDVTEVTLDDYNIELTKELRLLFSELIKKNL